MRSEVYKDWHFSTLAVDAIRDDSMSLFSEFKKFALRGNMIDLAIGFTVGAAFTTVMKSMVSDLIIPPIGLITGGADF